MPGKASILLFMVVLLACRGLAFAHHSLSAEFDRHKLIMMTGTVTKVEWTNPHTFFYIDVKDPNTSRVSNWACELSSPNALAARGWKPNTLRVGMIVSLSGIPAKDGSRKVNARNLIADGNRLKAWPSEDTNQ